MQTKPKQIKLGVKGGKVKKARAGAKPSWQGLPKQLTLRDYIFSRPMPGIQSGNPQGNSKGSQDKTPDQKLYKNNTD